MPKISLQPPAQLVEIPDTPSPIEEVRDTVRRNLSRLEEAFQRPENQEELQCAADTLRASLRTLENEAGRHEEYEMLSRVAAITHDVLKHIPITEFTQEQQQAFLQAARKTTDAMPERADVSECDRVLYTNGLDWLPPVPDYGDMEDDEEDDDTEDEIE
jgi:hypothetical protein